MQIRSRFLIVTSAAVAAFLAAGSFAKADDTTTQPQQQTTAAQNQPTPKKQAAAATDDKDAKAIADSASKVDLSSQISQLNFHGSATVGYESTFGKKQARQSGMFSELDLGSDIKLSKDVTMTVFVGVARYPNYFPYR